MVHYHQVLQIFQVAEPWLRACNERCAMGRAFSRPEDVTAFAPKDNRILVPMPPPPLFLATCQPAGLLGKVFSDMEHMNSMEGFGSQQELVMVF